MGIYGPFGLFQSRCRDSAIGKSRRSTFGRWPWVVSIPLPGFSYRKAPALALGFLGSACFNPVAGIQL